MRPLSPAQERLWLLEQSEGGSPYYNVNLAWEIKGELQVKALEASLDFLCQRHEVLRTSFPWRLNGPVQEIKNWHCHLSVVTLPHLGSGELKARANHFIREPFDIANGPLFRAVLFRGTDFASTLVVVTHQMVFDGASMRVFGRELRECYRAFSENEEPQLPKLPVRYVDFASWQRECLALANGDREFWQAELERTFEPLRLPVDRPRQNIGVTPGELATFSLSRELTVPLRRIGAECGVSSFAAFLAVFQAFLGRLTGQHDVLSLVSIAARNQADLRNLVGLVANVLPMRLDLSGALNLRSLLRRSGHVVSSALCHQMLPLSSILEMLPSAGADFDAPLLQTLVIYNNGPLPLIELGEVTFSPSVGFDNGTARFDLVLDVADSSEGIAGTLKYRSDLFEPQTIARLLSEWKEFIRLAIQNPDRELASIPLSQTPSVPLTPSEALISTAFQPGVAAAVGSAHTNPSSVRLPDSCVQRPNDRQPAPRKTPPRTDLERTLSKIWQDIFGISSIGMHDNFFGLGGHSLIGVRMIAAIEQATGQKLRLCKILQEPTIARLARAMECKEASATSSIIEIQPGGLRPALFLVHGVGGGMFWGYNNLARQLGPNQPVYAFKSRGMDGLEEFQRIEDMAAHYVTDLRRFQPSGPYHLGGYCFGGNVAYEMARQLRQQNQDVALLFLMNCWPNNSSYTRLRFTPLFLAKAFWNFCIRLAYQIRSNASQPRDFFKWRTAWLRKRIKSFFSPQTAESLAVEDIVDLTSRPEHERNLWRTHVEAWLRYQPLPYDGRVVLFRTRGHPLVCSYDNQMGWGSYAKGGVLVHICPGDHESILEDANVAATAAKLKTILDALNEVDRPRSTSQNKSAAPVETALIEPGTSPDTALQLGV